MSFDTTSSQPVLAAPVAGADAEATSSPGRRAAATPNLDYVFDDPAHGEPGRDRMLVHGLWELLLVLVLAGAAYLLYREESSAITGAGLRGLMIAAATLGALAAGSALSLRAGAPNLAVGAVAIAAALHFGRNAGGGVLQTLLVVVGLCALIGLVQGGIIVGLHVPAWAASLGVAVLLLAWSTLQDVENVSGNYDPVAHAYYWFGGFCALSVIASLVGLVPWVRRVVGRFRPVADPAHRRGWIAGLITLVATVVATTLAGVGGVLIVTDSGAPAASAGFELTALALGAALLGGTSAYGRRGGIFGTVFAVSLLVVLGEYGDETGRDWSPGLVAAAAIGLGLVVTRLVERYGRPRVSVADDEEELDWVPKIHGTSDGRTWSSTTATTTGGLWASDDAWGTSDRR